MRSIKIAALALALGSQCLIPAAGQTRFTTLYTFTGAYPGWLTAHNRVLYGTAGATESCGTLFELKPSANGGPWIETTLYTFSGVPDACGPSYPPLVAADGALYGLTGAGGAYDHGALYELQPPASPGGVWTETVLYSFDAPGEDVGFPGDSLVPGPGGSLYAPTSGGIYGSGALVQFQPPSAPGGAWTPVVLDSFYASATGAPGWLVNGPNGVLYATSAVGGTSQIGTVLQLTPPSSPGGTWTNTVLYNFERGDSYSPDSLLLAPSGTLYGTTFGNGINRYGKPAVFELAPPASPGGTWTFSIIRDFQSPPSMPLAYLRGNLYGTSGGVVFELQPPSTPGGAWTTTYLYNFNSGQNISSLVIDQGGTLYGAAGNGPLQPAGGIIYSIAPK